MQRPGRVPVRPARLLLLILLPLAGCAGSPERVAPVIVPAELRRCAPEPPTPASLPDDAALVDWIEDVRAAGADCRGVLASVVTLLPPP